MGGRSIKSKKTAEERSQKGSGGRVTKYPVIPESYVSTNSSVLVADLVYGFLNALFQELSILRKCEENVYKIVITTLRSITIPNN